MPAVAGVDRGRVVDEIFEGGDEAGEGEELLVLEPGKGLCQRCFVSFYG